MHFLLRMKHIPTAPHQKLLRKNELSLLWHSHEVLYTSGVAASKGATTDFRFRALDGSISTGSACHLFEI